MAVQTLQFKELTELVVLTDQPTTPGSTTLTAVAAAGGTALTVAAITNFADGDPIRISDGEKLEINRVSGAPAGNTITLARPLRKSHAIGATVVEQVAHQYGGVEGASCSVTVSRETSDVFEASQRLVYATLKGYGSARAQWQFTSLTIYNLALALGIPRSAILGTGADETHPLVFITKGNEFGSLNNASVLINGKLNDDSVMRVELFSVAFDYSGIAFQMTRGTLAAIPVNLLAGGGAIVTTTASLFTPAATYLGAAADVLDGLTDAGYFTDTATVTTLAEALAVGDITFDVTSAASFATGDIVRIGTGSAVEFHTIQGIAVNTITIASKILSAHASGEGFVKAAETSFANIDQAGANLNFGGTTSEIRSAFFDMAVGLRAGAASMEVTMALLEFTLANFARALGLPAPGANTTLDIFTGIGLGTIAGVYIRGLTQGSRVFLVMLYNNSLNVSSVQWSLTNQGDAPTIPLALKPSGLQVQVYT